MKLPIKVKPYAHQERAFYFVSSLFGLQNNKVVSTGAALLMEMGTGKTITTIAVMGELYRQKLAKRTLIICPLSITGVWQEELAKFADFDYTAVTLEGDKAKKKDTLRHMVGSPLQVVICNYESAWRLQDELLRYNADIVIADESHRIKTHNSKQSKALHKFGAKARYKMLLTGTVITNKAIDVFSQYKFINPDIFGQSFYVFRNKYFDMTGYGQYTPVLKKSKETDFTKLLHSIAFRATKSECLDLPETVDIVRYVDLEEDAIRIYKNLVKDSYTELSNGGEVTATNVLTLLMRLSQLTGGFLGEDDSKTQQRVSTAKMNMLENIIEESLNEGQKVVVMTRFVAEIRAIRRLLEKKNLQYSLVMGRVKDRDGEVARFQNNPQIPVFIGQIATAGEGITLTASCVIIFYSLDYSMSHLEQAKARIHRVGQTQDCTYYYLTARNTVDEKILKALNDKADLAKTLVDDYRKGMNPFQ